MAGRTVQVGRAARPVDEEVARMAGKFEVYEDAGGKYRFRLKAGNGEIVATGQGYASKDAAHKGVEAVQRAASGASVVDVAKSGAAA
ncbi:YegP family protein [Kitasatospora sp. NPDC089913]|uniref:YegP family protein n=2 Tax=Streptomycetaceae TaxID=2062 RepID=UPI000B32584B|nr:DUF1508 domain-containing protein [Streptomyces sp. TLI_053]